jgi:hypothetical protein
MKLTSLDFLETPEEAAERLYPENEQWTDRHIFTLGVKWQAERSYSEEEVLYILREFYKVSSKKDFPLTNTIPVWFEQFKK